MARRSHTHDGVVESDWSDPTGDAQLSMFETRLLKCSICGGRYEEVREKVPAEAE